jgi:integrase
MSLYRDEKSPHWFVSLSVNGKRVRKSTGTAIKKQAQRIHDELKADLWQRKITGHTWQDAMVEWLTVAPRDPSDRYRLRAFTLPDLPLSDITAATFEEHLTGVPGTYNRMINLITAILNHAKSKGWLTEVPKIQKKKTGTQRIRWLTQEEWERLRAELPDHLQAMATFAISTGLRKANVTGLEWAQVDLRRKVTWIHPDQAKAKKPIGIPLSDDALEILKAQVGKHKTRVFTYNGKPLTGIKAAWGKALQRAGLGEWIKRGDGLIFEPNFRWHDLRHTWATWHVQSGTPLAVLQKLGGWASYSMVLKYAHFAPEYLAQFANNAKPYKADNGQNVA